MSASFHHLVSRGIEASSRIHHEYQSMNVAYKVPTWGIVLMVLTGLVYLFVSCAIEYTYFRMIPALIMVESSDATLFEPLSTEDPDSKIDSKTEPEMEMVKREPITSSFCRTIRYLRERDGTFGSRFRGYRMWVVSHVAIAWTAQLMSVVMPREIAACLAAVLLANLSMAWTHVVVSERNNGYFFQRIPSLKFWKKIAGPTAFLAIAQQLALIVPLALAVLAMPNYPSDVKHMNGCARAIVGLKAAGIILSAFAMVFMVVIPANVALTRIQASLLPDNEQTIVPFDRTFGGKVVSEELGGTGVIGFLDAWKTFERSSRVRLFKAYIKVIAMQMALMVAFLVVAVAEVLMIVGYSNIEKMQQEYKKNHNA